MSYLSKLTVKTVVRTNKLDPVIQRRQKLISATEEQLKVVKSAIKGESLSERYCQSKARKLCIR